MDEWVDIKGYEGIYAVSRNGEVKSLKRTIFQPNHGNREIKEYKMHPWDNGHGYKVVTLNRNGKRTNHYVHRLVAEHFISNPNHYNVVNHIDFNRGNNRVENLEWVTQKMNIHHSLANMGGLKHRSTYNPNTNTGYSYIYLRPGKNVYRVIVKGSERYAQTIEQAIKKRDAMLKEAGICLTAY